MSLDRVSSGRGLHNDFNVIIEIPMNADPHQTRSEQVNRLNGLHRYGYIKTGVLKKACQNWLFPLRYWPLAPC